MFKKPWQSIKKYKQVYKKYKNTWESIKSIKSVPPGLIWLWTATGLHCQIRPGGTDFILVILSHVFFIIFVYLFILVYTLPWLYKHFDQKCWNASRGFMFFSLTAGCQASQKTSENVGLPRRNARPRSSGPPPVSLCLCLSRLLVN